MTTSINTAKMSIKFQCDLCHKEFSRDTSLAVHMCEPKRRQQARGERGVQIAFQAFLKFYEQAQGSSRLKSESDFEQSPYYRAFVKWGRYSVNVQAINPERWLEWLLSNNKKIDRWATDSCYDEYLLWYLLQEPATDAVSRGIEFSIDWAEKNQANACDLLRYGNPNRVLHCINTGRISAWILYNCESGQEFLAQLDQHSIEIIWPYIDSDRWQSKFKNFLADQAYCQEILTKAGW